MLLTAPPVLTATPAGADVVVEPLVAEALVLDVVLDAASDDLLEDPALVVDSAEPADSELDAGDEVDEEVPALDVEALLDEDSDDPVSAHAVP